jgi:cardiolipin synthase (CMP-forming)
MEKLVRQWTLATVLVSGAWMACFVFLWSIMGPRQAVRWGAPAMATAVLLMAFVRLSLHQNRRGPGEAILPFLGGANVLTIARGGATVILAGFLLLPPLSTPLTWLIVGLFLFVALGDIVDGYWARASGQETLLGRRLDGMVDALAMLVAVVLAVRWGRLPDWFLALGIAPYAFGLAVELHRRRGRPSRVLPYRLSRRLAGAFLFGFVAVALSPLFPGRDLSVAAVLVALPVVTSFLMDWRLLTRPGPN